MSIGFCGKSSPDGSGICHMLFLSPVPWLYQSRVMNWIHAAASMLRLLAGTNVSRVSSSRLMTRGFGAMICGSGSGHVNSGGTLRPKRIPAEPMRGSRRSLNVPSAVRWVR